MSGREELERLKAEHKGSNIQQSTGGTARRCLPCSGMGYLAPWPCPTSRLIAALESLLNVPCIPHLVAQAQEEALAHLASQDLSKPKAVSSEPSPKEKGCILCKGRYVHSVAECAKPITDPACDHSDHLGLCAPGPPTPDGVAEAKEKA